MSVHLCLFNTLSTICSMYCDTQAGARVYEPDDYTTAGPVLRRYHPSRRRTWPADYIFLISPRVTSGASPISSFECQITMYKWREMHHQRSISIPLIIMVNAISDFFFPPPSYPSICLPEVAGVKKAVSTNEKNKTISIDGALVFLRGNYVLGCHFATCTHYHYLWTPACGSGKNEYPCRAAIFVM